MFLRADNAGGVPHRLPPRNPAHEPIDWFETDYDDQFDDPDVPDFDPLPTERHRRVPGFDYGD